MLKAPTFLLIIQAGFKGLNKHSFPETEVDAVDVRSYDAHCERKYGLRPSRCTGLLMFKDARVHSGMMFLHPSMQLADSATDIKLVTVIAFHLVDHHRLETYALVIQNTTCQRAGSLSFSLAQSHPQGLRFMRCSDRQV